MDAPIVRKNVPDFKDARTSSCGSPHSPLGNRNFDGPFVVPRQVVPVTLVAVALILKEEGARRHQYTVVDIAQNLAPQDTSDVSASATQAALADQRAHATKHPVRHVF